MDNEKDILNMFKVTSKVTMDKERKQEIKMSVLNSRPVIVQKSFFSMSFAIKYAYVPLALVLVFIGGLGVKINNEQNNLKDAIETISGENDLESPIAVSLLAEPQDNDDPKKSSRNMAFGTQEVSPKINPTQEPKDSGLFMATAMPVVSPFEFEVEGLIGGYDKEKPIILKVIAKNILDKEQKITLNKDCVSYYVVDSIDSREGKACPDAYMEKDILPLETETWSIEIPIHKMNLSFGTHLLTFGIQGYFERTAEFVVE